MEFIKEYIEIILLTVIIVLLLIEPINKLYRRNKYTNTDKTVNIKLVKQKNTMDKLLEILPALPDELQYLLNYKQKAEDYDLLKMNFERTTNLLETKNKTLSNEKTKLEKDFANERKETSGKFRIIEEQNTANQELLTKIRKAEHFKEFAGKVSDYLKFINITVKKAYNQCLEFSIRDEKTGKIMFILLHQTLTKIEAMPILKQICDDIQENGIVIMKDALKNCFQSDKDAEQIIAFKTKCINELKEYTNAILIFCESYGNLSGFVENSDVSSLEKEYKNMISEIKGKAKNCGIMEIEEIHIFTNIDKNEGAEAISEQISLPYTLVKSLNKDDIVQIISYGMKSEYGDKILKTKVLIK